MLRKTSQLPQETARPVKAKAILISVLGSLLIVLCANAAAIRYLPHHGLSMGDRLITFKWDLLLDMEEPVDWLILGDSSGAFGVVPSLFNESLGVTSINLCTHGGLGVVNDAWMLGSYIERFGPPKNVLLVHALDGWEGKPSVYNMQQIPLKWGYWNHLQPPVELSLKQNCEAFVVRYVPLYSHNHTLVTMLKGPWKLFAPTYLTFEDDGLVVPPGALPQKVVEEAERIASSLGASEQRVGFNEIVEKALEHAAALAEEYGFNLFLANGPIYEGLYSDLRFQTHVNPVRDWLDAFAAGHQRLQIVLRSPMTFPADQMEDHHHVVYAAALRYTEELVSAIMQCEESQ